MEPDSEETVSENAGFYNADVIAMDDGKYVLPDGAVCLSLKSCWLVKPNSIDIE